MSMHLREAYESQSSSQPSILVCSGAFQRTHHHPLDTAVTVLCELSGLGADCTEAVCTVDPKAK